MTQLDFAALEAGILHKWDMAERAKYESEPVLRLWIKLNATERILNLDPEYQRLGCKFVLALCTHYHATVQVCSRIL